MVAGVDHPVFLASPPRLVKDFLVLVDEDRLEFDGLALLGGGNGCLLVETLELEEVFIDNLEVLVFLLVGVVELCPEDFSGRSNLRVSHLRKDLLFEFVYLLLISRQAVDLQVEVDHRSFLFSHSLLAPKVLSHFYLLHLVF